jgi:hypothetical protein
MGSSPQVVDWNSDGEADLISGDRSGYFNVWVWRDTGFEAHTQYQKMDMNPLNVGANSQPTIIDWNGDGKKDLLVGCENGQVLFWPNLTSDTWPMFQTVETVAAGGGPLYQYRVNPVVFDLDRDGVNDLVCGENGGYVLFYRNTGTNSDPVLAAAETLKTPRGLPVQGSGTYGSRCWFGFWDADSLPDLLVSAYDGYVELFRGALPVSVEEGQRAPAPLALCAGPNPTTGRSTISCEASASAELVVCDNLGRAVRHLGVLSGPSVKVWDGRNDSGAEVNSGVYFCRLTGSGQAASARIVLSR